MEIKKYNKSCLRSISANYWRKGERVAVIIMKNNRILIVDDEPDLTMLFKIGLEDNGFEVDVFNDPRTALSAFRERPFMI